MAKTEKKRPKRGKQQEPAEQGITKLIVNNFKSLAAPEPYEIEVRPLTILAGANSSGKSSAMQPLLLLKQTLEASFDPGPLLLDGPHVKFSSTEQIFPRSPRPSPSADFHVGLEVAGDASLEIGFKAIDENKINVEMTCYTDGNRTIRLGPGLVDGEPISVSSATVSEIRKHLHDWEGEIVFHVAQRRSFFELRMELGARIADYSLLIGPVWSAEKFEREIVGIIHVPGLRGNPERSYRTTAVHSTFPGTFENYVASAILHWQQRDASELRQLWSDLEHLGLTWKVVARQLDAVSVEIKVGRLPHAGKGSSEDLVNIADVGFGVSQTLPVLVALLVARPGQLVYIEQPEIHLHPKAQVALAEILAAAARRGVRVIIETHSALLLLAIQALVAEGKLDPNLAILHWFQRNKVGISEITSTQLDEQGAYGNWPEDFGEVEMAIQRRYLDAAEEQLLRAARG